jgi:hypothetical protein
MNSIRFIESTALSELLILKCWIGSEDMPLTWKLIFPLRYRSFSNQAGTGLDSLLVNSSKDFVELVKMMLVYDPEERITAR